MMLKPINLQLGWPSPYLVPQAALLSATATVLSSPKLTEGASIYGPDPGQPEVRQHIAEWLTKSYHPSAGQVTSDRIILCNGASANLGCILAKFSDPVFTRRIWMVEPTYFLACPTFQDAGFAGRLRGVPEDEEGIDIAFLQRSIEADENSTEATSSHPPFKSPPNNPKLYRHIIYAVPTFANPTAKTMSLRRRTQLVQLARAHDALVITDDVYDLLRWSADPSSPSSTTNLGSPPPRLVDIDRSLPGCSEYGNSVSNGSFSKIVAPGARVSWAEATPTFITTLSTVGSTRSGGSPSQMSSIFVDQLLTTGELNRHIQQVLIPTYAKRSRAMMNAIREFLVPTGVNIDVGIPFTDTTAPETVPQDGGFFTYMTFPEHLPPAREIARLAREKYALKIASGSMMTIVGDEGSEERVDPRGVRLSWSWHSERTLVRGVKRLARLVGGLEGKGGGMSEKYEEDDGDDGEESGVETYFHSN